MKTIKSILTLLVIGAIKLANSQTFSENSLPGNSHEMAKIWLTDTELSIMQISNFNFSFLK